MCKKSTFHTQKQELVGRTHKLNQQKERKKQKSTPLFIIKVYLYVTVTSDS
jgi:hypothetical protein